MNTNNVVNEVFTDIESGKFEQANALLADDFKGMVLGKEVNRPVYISAYRSLRQGIPDLKFDVQHVKTEGSKVKGTVKISGTNTHAIPALMKGWHEIPATNKKVEGLVMDLEVTLKNDKIEGIKLSQNMKGLFATLLDNLGTDYKKFRAN